MSEGSGRGIIRFHPFGHPHVWSEMFAFRVEFFKLATVEERLFRFGRVEWEALGSLSQICSWGRDMKYVDSITDGPQVHKSRCGSTFDFNAILYR